MTTSKDSHRRLQSAVKFRLLCSEICYCVRQHHTPKTIVSTSMTEQQFGSYMAPFWTPHTISRRHVDPRGGVGGYLACGVPFATAVTELP